VPSDRGLHGVRTMRLVASALALILFASFARAEEPREVEPAPAGTAAAAHGKITLRVVRVMSQSHQALLFDRARGTHVLAEVGSKIDGYTVDAIEEDEVTLSLDGRQIVLAAPARGGSRRHERDLAATHVRPTAAARQPETMAALPTPPEPAPLDPYGEATIRTVEAPGAAEARSAGTPARAIEAGDGGVRVAEAPASDARVTGRTEDKPTGIRVVEAPTGAPASETQVDPGRIPAGRPDAQADAQAAPEAPDVRASDSVRAPDKQALDARAMADVMSAGSGPRVARTPVPAADPRPAAPAAPAAPASLASEIRTAPAAALEAVVLRRGDVDAALGDFTRLATGVRGSWAASGLVVDAVSDGSIFQRAGLRAGDVITAVDGTRLRSLDDAANLYARASTAKAIAAQIVRGGTPMTLRVAIQ
jgi:hypothetical protein